MANDILSGYIKAVKGLNILDEWDIVTRGEDGEEVKGVKNHCSDAGLYIWRYSYTSFMKDQQPRRSTEQQMMDSLIQQSQREREDRDNEGY